MPGGWGSVGHDLCMSRGAPRGVTVPNPDSSLPTAFLLTDKEPYKCLDLTSKSFYILQSCLINKKTNTDLDLNFLFNVERALFHVFLQSQFKMCHPGICKSWDGALCQMLSCIQWKPLCQFSYLGRVLNSQREASAKQDGVSWRGACWVVCFPIKGHCGYFSPRVSSGEVLKLGVNREMLIKLVAAVALK